MHSPAPRCRRSPRVAFTFVLTLAGISPALADGRERDARVEEAEAAAEALKRAALLNQADAQPTPEQINEVKSRIADLSKQVNASQAELQKAQQQMRQLEQQIRDNQPLEGEEEVKAATLPLLPTREQCEAYITTLREAVANRNRASENHLVVKKLRMIPKEHIDLVAQEYLSGSRLGRYYARYVLTDADNRMLRKLVVDSLDEHPDNIFIVITHGWCLDIKDKIKKMLNNGELLKAMNTNDMFARWWFQAAVEISDPELYPAMHQLVLETKHWEVCLMMLQTLPDFDTAATLDACLNKGKPPGSGYYGRMRINSDFDGFSRQRLGKFSEPVALMAAEAGNIDALEAIIQAIPDTEDKPLNSDWQSGDHRLRALRFIKFRGTNSEIKDWFKAHRDQLVFDQFTKQFVMPESPTTDSAAPQPQAIQAAEPAPAP